MDEPFDSRADEPADEDAPEDALVEDDGRDEVASDPHALPDAEGIVGRLRAADFGVARRGYDRRQVDEFLARIARRIEAETQSFDPDALKRQLQRVGESTTGILTAAEETARKLHSDAAQEAEELRRSATEAAERLRSEASEFAQATREQAVEEARRLTLEATQKVESATAEAERRADELLEQSLERRRVLEARIGRLLEERAGVVGRLRDLSKQLEGLVESDELGTTGQHDDDLLEELEDDDLFDQGEDGSETQEHQVFDEHDELDEADEDETRPLPRRRFGR
jgi:DivIVA domain-containing protein